MKIYQAKIRPKTSFITPLHSDSIFGALCWVIQKSEGTESLKKVLSFFKDQDPPFVVSNGFPGDYMPKPFIPPKRTSTADEQSKEQLIKRATEGKRLKKMEYLSLEEFNNILEQGTCNLATKPKPYVDMPILHSSIDRWSETALENVGLYNTVERFSRVDYWSIYVKVKEEWREKLEKWLSLLGEMGFGKRKSVGKGSFTLLEFALFDSFINPETPNAFTILSNYVPSAKDPVKGFYKTLVKYGKLDGEYALESSPFKTPVLMVVPGSVFLTDNVKDYYGRMVTQVSPHYPDVMQYGYAFSVPAIVDDE